MNTRAKGSEGEAIARDFLIENGYEIIENNYAKRTGEIDIIAKHGEAVVFIEVKLRKNTRYGYPREAVGYKKQQTIKKLASKYISENGLKNTDFRFDVIEIIQDKETIIEHIKDAFW